MAMSSQGPHAELFRQRAAVRVVPFGLGGIGGRRDLGNDPERDGFVDTLVMLPRELGRAASLLEGFLGAARPEIRVRQAAHAHSEARAHRADGWSGLHRFL